MCVCVCVCVCMCVCICILPSNTSHEQDATQGKFLSSLTISKSEFTSSLTGCYSKIKELRLPNYLPIAGWRIVGFLPFPRILEICEMQRAPSSNSKYVNLKGLFILDCPLLGIVTLSYASTSTYMQIHAGYILTQWITTREDFFRKICTSHFIVRVRKGLLRVLL